MSVIIGPTTTLQEFSTSLNQNGVRDANSLLWCESKDLNIPINDPKKVSKKLKELLEQAFQKKYPHIKKPVPLFEKGACQVIDSIQDKETQQFFIGSVKNAFSSAMYAAGTLSFMQNAFSFENPNLAQKMVPFLLSDNPLPEGVISCELLKSLFVKKNPELRLQFRNEVQRILRLLFQELQKNPQGNEEKLVQIQIGNLLALLPFFEPDPAVSMEVPQRTKNGWQLVSYRVEVLHLTPPSLGSPIQAFGFIPDQAFPDAEPLLLFRGTPFPTLSGSLLSVFTDFVPFYSVGEFVYDFFSKNIIHEWIEKTNKKVKLYGISLGGALALLSLTKGKENVAEIHAFAPPCVYTLKNEFLKDVPVNIYWRENDPVPLTGAGFASSWKVYRIFTNTLQNFFLAHVRVFPGLTDCAVVQIKPEMGNTSFSRKIFTLLHHIISIPIFLILGSIVLIRFVYFSVVTLLFGSKSR